MSKATNARAHARCVHLEKTFDDFKVHFKDDVHMELDRYTLYSAAVCYFEDVDRLKHFHGMERVDDVKQAGFTIKWLAKFRPIWFSSDGEVTKELQYANETFALRCGLSFMKLGLRSLPDELAEEVLYTLRHRSVDERLLFIWLETIKRAIRGDFLDHMH